MLTSFANHFARLPLSKKRAYITNHPYPDRRPCKDSAREGYPSRTLFTTF